MLQSNKVERKEMGIGQEEFIDSYIDERDVMSNKMTRTTVMMRIMLQILRTQIKTS